MKAKGWEYLLNDREKRAVKAIRSIYKKKYHGSADADRNLIAFLGDNPQQRLCWSGASGRVPALRLNQGKMYSLFRRRWLVPREKLALMGFPVAPDVALSMGVPILGVTDGQRAAQVAGNCMHFSCVLLAEFLAMLVFSPRGNHNGRFGRYRLFPDSDSDGSDA